MERINLGEADGLPLLEWADVVATLESKEPPARDDHNSRTTWLVTINEDGTPHVTPVGALWLDGAFWFQTGKGTRKRANLLRDPRCTVSVSAKDADLVVEGEASRVTDTAAIAQAARAWADQGWPAEPDETGTGLTAPFNAPTLGPPPWEVYRVELRSVVASGVAEPGGLTRFRF